MLGKLFLRAKYGNDGYNAGRLVWFVFILFVAWFVLGVKSCNDVRDAWSRTTVTANVVGLEPYRGLVVTFVDPDSGQKIQTTIGVPKDKSSLSSGTVKVSYKAGHPQAAGLHRGGWWIAPLVFLTITGGSIGGLIGLGSLMEAQSNKRRGRSTKHRR
ncbi:MAG: hypothetical protein AAGF84_00460 [Planctomycetota bacterium]